MRSLLTVILLALLGAVVPAQDEDDAPPPPPPPIMGQPAAPQPARSTLRARVYYEDNGRPVRRTNVMLLGKGPGDASGTTDANGNLEIRGIAAGKYYALVNAPGILSPLANIDIRQSRGMFDEGLFEGVPAIEIDGLTDIVTEIPARRGAAIGGRVTYADGTPAIGVTVEVLRKVGDEFLPNLSSFTSMLMGAGLGGFRTDDRGIYRFAGLPAGGYIVKVTENVEHGAGQRAAYPRYQFAFPGSLGSLVSTFFEAGSSPDAADIVTVQLGQEMSEINIVIPDRALSTIEGRLVAAKDKLPVRGAKLTIKRVGDERVVSMFSEMGRVGLEQGVTTDEKGAWKFTELPKGTYEITAEPGSSEFDAKDRAYGDAPGDDSDYPSANVAYGRAMNTAYNAMLRAGGNASRRGPEKPPAPKFAKAVKEFTIDDSDLGEQIIELTYGATIIGTVTFEEEATGERGSVSIVTTSEKGGIGSRQTLWFTDYEGKVVYLNSKDFRLEAIPSGRSTVSITAPSGESYVKSAASNQIDLLKGPIEFREGDVFANVRIVISNQTGTLKGVVVDQDKQPVAGADLVFMPVDPAKFRNSTYYRTVKSRSNGEFEVRLPPYEYALIATPPPSGSNEAYYTWLADAVKNTQTFKIEARKTTTATIKWVVSRPQPAL